MGELVELDVTTVEESVTVNVTEEGAVQVAVFAEKGDTGPAGPAGPNSVTSATTSDGTCELSLASLEAGSRDGLPILNSDGDEVAVIGRDNSNDGESGTITGVQFGFDTKASGNHSFANGAGAIASGDYSHASGSNTESQGAYSNASGVSSLASGLASNAEGEFTIASGNYSKAIGSNTTASGLISFAGGVASTASGDYSYAYGTNAKAIHDGASVESDSEAADVESSTTDEKTFRFANGYRFLGGPVAFVNDGIFEGTLTANHIHGNLAGSVYAHIRAGENLVKGDPVYVSGSHGSGETLIPVVSKADAANAAKMPAVGVMDAAVSNNSNGHMVITGTITELNTNAYPVNTVLYVATGGGWTSTPPAANSQAVAIVERSNTNNGAVIVKANGLGSSGGNGAADANKLVRYSSTGGASLTGGTLTDMTYAGTAAFTSTTRPTSAGTGAPAATSLITRADGDARFSQVVAASLTAGVDSDVNTTNYKTVSELSFALEIGTYFIDAVLVHNGNASFATSGVKDRLNFSGTATASGSVYRVLDNATTSSSVPNARISTNTLVESAPSNRSQTTWRKGVLTVTAAGTLSVQIAQTVAVVGANTTLATGSHLTITRLI